MKLSSEFVVARSREEVARVFDDDATFEALLPDTRIVSSRDGVRETRTSYSASRDIRFVFETLPDGDMRFEKICNGNVWRSLVGGVTLEPEGPNHTLVRLRMEGQTRALVPELAIRGPLREQLDQMGQALRERLERPL